MTTLNLNHIAELVRAKAIDARVDDIGGAAMIYAGPTHQDAEGETRFAAFAGPGSFGPNGTATADTEELFIGPDAPADDVMPFDVGGYEEITTEEQVAALLVGQIQLRDPTMSITEADAARLLRNIERATMSMHVRWTVGETTTYSQTVDVAEVFGEEDARRVQAELDAGADARAMLREMVDDGIVLKDYLAELETDRAARVERFYCDSRTIDQCGLVVGQTVEEISVSASPEKSEAAEHAAVEEPTADALLDKSTVTLPEWATTERPALDIESKHGFCSWCSTAYSNNPGALALEVTPSEAGQEPFGVHPHCLEPMRGEALRRLVRERLRDVLAEIEPFTKAYDAACQALNEAPEGENKEPHYSFYQRRDDAGKDLADRTGALVTLVKTLL